MTIAWGNDLLDTSKGLDVLGVRRIDQAVESELVNGTTTISQRARYLSILPWALGEYLVNHASEGFEAHRLTAYLRRIEFVILAASRLDSRHNRANANGALGAYLYKDQLARLMNGEPVMFPEDGRQQILGIYFAPCQAIGLLLDRDQTVPYRLTPRGKKIWEVRQERLQAAPVMTAISTGEEFSPELAETAIPHFSLGSLSSSGEEATLLHRALVNPWSPISKVEQARVVKAYSGINKTIAWANGMLTSGPDNAAGLIVRNFKSCCEQRAGAQIEFAWAEYEYRRRCHFALELLLAALTDSLADSGEASTGQVVSEWARSFEPAPLLSEIWPSASDAWRSTAFESVASVPRCLFASKRIPTSDLGCLTASNQALASVALLAATASQTRAIRRDGRIDHKPASPGEKAVESVEKAGEEPFSELIVSLVELTALAHLQTTLRKMGAGQKCSLRFFPDGPFLRPTGIRMDPGHSGDRLTSVLRILTDIGKLRREAGMFTVSDGGGQ